MNDTIYLKTETCESKIKFVGEFSSRILERENKSFHIVIDENVNTLYPDFLPECEKIVLKSEENMKNFETANSIILNLIKKGTGKDTLLLGVGGGVITDLTGFVASIYKRGIKFGFVPTSLMAMADAAIGGKNGINSGNVKNVVGVINQPDFIIIDVNFLQTLPDENYYSAFSEIVKIGLVDKPGILDLIESNYDKIKTKDTSFLNELIFETVKSKVSIVEKDVNDKGERRILNFGHTIGHALELTLGFSHGMAVAAGLLYELNLSEIILGTSTEIRKRVMEIFYDLELDFKGFNNSEINNIVLKHDKKNLYNILNIVLLKDYGDAYIKSFPYHEINNIFEICKIF
jgi:3-dehydroquinate synthase